MPIVSTPSMMRRLPRPITTAAFTPVRSGGTAERYCAITPRSFSEVTTRAWWPAQVPKNSDSAPSRLERLEALEARHRRANQLAALLQEAHAGIAPPAREQLQHDEVERGDADAEQRQRGVVLEHQRREDADEQQAHEVGGELARRAARRRCC